MSQPKFITNPSYDQLHNAAIAMVREARTLGWIDGVLAPFTGWAVAWRNSIPQVKCAANPHPIFIQAGSRG
jgi:hypothetical protein